MPNYFRRPGQKVTYTPQQTARYVSKNARWQRGLRLAPSWQRNRSGGGFEFGFFSARGPAKDQGHWIVTATKNSNGGAPGSGSSPGSGGDPADVGNLTILAYFHEQPGLPNGSPYAPGSPPPGGNGTYPDPDPPTIPLPRSRYPSFSLRLSNGKRYRRLFFSTAYEREDGTAFPKFGSLFDKLLFWLTRYYLVLSIRRDEIVSTFQLMESEIPNFYNPAGSEYEIYYHFESASGSESGLLGGDSNPSNPGDGHGKYDYSCTCPDFTKIQPKLFAPVYPSEYRNRSWVNSNAGALPGPPKFCKHIVAVVALLNDGAFFGNINLNADIPAAEFHYDRQQEHREQFRRRLRRQPQQSFDVFWNDVNQLLDQRRRQRRLNNNLDRISRVRLYDELIPTGQLASDGTPDYAIEQRFYSDQTGRNLSPEQFQRYFTRQLQYANRWP